MFRISLAAIILLTAKMSLTIKISATLTAKILASLTTFTKLIAIFYPGDRKS
jgi:hypothetical protein